MIEAAKQRDTMTVEDWISNRQALLNTYHDVEKLEGEVETLEKRVNADEAKENVVNNTGAKDSGTPTDSAGKDPDPSKGNS